VSAAENIKDEASRWLAARDARELDTEERAAFERWIDADVSHRVAYLRAEAMWRRTERLRALKPLDRDVDANLLRERRAWNSPRVLGLAACVAVALVSAAGWVYAEHFSWQRYETRVGGFSRIVLEDGSVVDLNTDTEIRVRLGDARREVRLMRGEGKFKVAHERDRPFVVSAADADVRAVGTAFTVRLRSEDQVQVLVVEGKVAIDASNDKSAPAVAAGEAAMVLPDSVSVTRVEPQKLERQLAWTSGQLHFRGESLAEAVTEFNRYNRRRIHLSDPSIANLRIGGNFNATDPESFAAAVKQTFKLRMESASSDAIVLRPP
jgi:transmembrane sensor